MLIKLHTLKTMVATADYQQAVVNEQGIGVIKSRNLKEAMEKNGAEFGRACLIFEVFHPKFAMNFLQGEVSLSKALPGRSSIHEEVAQTFMPTLKSSALMGKWDLPELNGVARVVGDTLFKIRTTAAA